MVHGFVLGMPSERTNNFPESGRGLGHITPTIFGSTVGYPSDSLASCNVCITAAIIINGLVPIDVSIKLSAINAHICPSKYLVSFLADRTDGRAYATVLRLSVRLSVCHVMYCG